MKKSIKIQYLSAIALATFFASNQIHTKHYSKEKQDECRAVADVCKKVIDTAIRCKESCDILAEDRSNNYLEDKRICVTRCKETVAACESCIEQCRFHLKGMENKEERRNMNRCIKKCKNAIHACKHTMRKCHVDNSKKDCINACRECSKTLDETIEACREVAIEENTERAPTMEYELEEYEY